MQLRYGARFSPHVLVLPLTLVLAVPPMRGTIVSGVHWWWNESFRRATFVMDEAHPNEGYPYIQGHFEGEVEPHNLVGEQHGNLIGVKALPSVAFAPGKRLEVWTSPDAPNFVAFGQEVNDVPVESLPVRPGLGSFLLYATWLLATGVAGLAATVWVANRFSRSAGTLPITRQPPI